MPATRAPAPAPAPPTPPTPAPAPAAGAASVCPSTRASRARDMSVSTNARCSRRVGTYVTVPAAAAPNVTPNTGVIDRLDRSIRRANRRPRERREGNTERRGDRVSRGRGRDHRSHAPYLQRHHPGSQGAQLVHQGESRLPSEGATAHRPPLPALGMGAARHSQRQGAWAAASSQPGPRQRSPRARWSHRAGPHHQWPA